MNVSVLEERMEIRIEREKERKRCLQHSSRQTRFQSDHIAGRGRAPARARAAGAGRRLSIIALGAGVSPAHLIMFISRFHLH
ncbi:hypothetical protein EVAR_39477_1 [Eumeta japonica]|uniref:Uncharacterized protein n=1 Tax=Eumeta variegata TaxID=151549 RepID=A0A4C1W1V7_EUMVA|nr:hypothetical protein EVAR_39477_1 [Eumeta japonica]